MRTRGAAKRRRGHGEEIEFLSLRDTRRQRLPVKAKTLWKKSLTFTGPKALDLFNASGRLIIDDDFVLQAAEMTRLDRQRMQCLVPKVQPCLPPQLRSVDHRQTLVLDIDETLVHSEQQLRKDVIYDHVFEVEYLGMKKKIGMNKRPFVEEFLAWCSEHFEVATFTSGVKPYSEKVVKILDPTGERVKYRLCRDQCTMYDECTYFKNLAYLRRDLSKTLIIDNSPIVFAYQLDNGVPIQSFYGEKDEEDNELLKLKNFLEEVLKAEDVRTLIQQKFKMGAFLDYIRDDAAAAVNA